MAENEEKDLTMDEIEGKSKSGMLLFIGIFVAQILIATAIVIFYVMPILNPGGDEDESSAEEASSKEVLQLSYKLSNLTVNPRNSMGRRFAVFEVVMEVSDEMAMTLLKKREPILRDRFINYLRSMTIADLSMDKTMDEGRNRLQEIANEIIEAPKVTQVYFTRFVLQ